MHTDVSLLLAICLRANTPVAKEFMKTLPKRLFLVMFTICLTSLVFTNIYEDMLQCITEVMINDDRWKQKFCSLRSIPQQKWISCFVLFFALITATTTITNKTEVSKWSDLFCKDRYDFLPFELFPQRYKQLKKSEFDLRNILECKFEKIKTENKIIGPVVFYEQETVGASENVFGRNFSRKKKPSLWLWDWICLKFWLMIN